MRPPRLISLTLLTASLWLSLGVAGHVDLPLCLMLPPYPEMRLPGHGFILVHDEDPGGKCNDVPTKNWIRKSSGSAEIFVHADGPSGSGRYWNVFVGVAERGQLKPARGVCFTTSTVGWRTLQRFKDVPLPWLEDFDQDGNAELVVWDSFALHQEPSMAEVGLVAWVYRLTPEDSFEIDWKQTRQMAREIAKAYRAPLDSKDRGLNALRAEAARALEQFADEQCTVGMATNGN